LYGTTELYQRLYAVNMLLWDVEDKLRELEKNINFGIDFIESAREVYKLNDKRADIKKELNKLYQSDIIEEKSYK
jgi:ABC-type phosphate transport system auxiliary subunit